MFGDYQGDAELRAAWQAFCSRLAEAGELIFRDHVPKTGLDRAEGLQYVARNIALALQFELENNDPLHPEMMQYFTPTRKQGGDNSDCVYLGAPVNGTDTYVVRGNRGGARHLVFCLVETGHTPWGGGTPSVLFGPDLECDAEGNFELIISPDKHRGNWLRSTPDTFRLTIRQYFGDWENEAPLLPSIARVGNDGDVPAPLTPARLNRGLCRAGAWVGESTRFWADAIDLWKARPNAFMSWGEVQKIKIDATPGGTPLICYWQVDPDEALVARVTPPSICGYWNLEFGSYWWTTFDYRYHHCALNDYSGRIEKDGSLLFVVSHVDPGVHNWLDPAGHNEGYIGLRWMNADSTPYPDVEIVKFADLESVLPADHVKASPEDRRELIEHHRRGLVQRWRLLV
jgi:hypothetical protein